MTLLSRPQQRGTVASWLRRWEIQIVFLIAAAVLVNTALSPHFLDVNNLFDMTFNFMEKAIIALAMTFIIIRSDIDLSVASSLAMSAIVMASLYQSGVNIWAAVVIGLAVGLLGGVLNGVLVAKVKLPALVVTLGTLSLYRGVAWTIVGDLTIKNFPAEFNYLGQGYIPGTPVPFVLVLFAALAVIFGLVLHRTTFGRYVYAIGQNEEACRFSGVRVDRIKIALFAASGLMSALAGVVMAARFGSARADIGQGFELDVITAVVLGGVDIGGGSGTMPGVVLALFLLGIVRFGMSLVNIRGQIQSIVVGILLIVAILVPNLTRGTATVRREGRSTASRTRTWIAAAGAGLLVVVVAGLLFQFGYGPFAGMEAPGSAPGSDVGLPATAVSSTEVQIEPTPTPRQAPPTPTSWPTPTPEPTTSSRPVAASSAVAGPSNLSRPDVPIVKIPAGAFLFGSNEYEPNEAPQQKVDLPAFTVDQFEVTNAEFAAFATATGYVTDAEKASSKKTWRSYFTAGKDNHPVVKVSFNDAGAFCKWLGRRLPTEQEWEKAARGTDGRDYPWGDAWDSTRANGQQSGLRGTAAVGSFHSGASPYGAEDMSGNVWEWTSSPYLAYPGSSYQDPNYSPDLRVTRGGGWFDDPKTMRTSVRNALTRDAGNDDLGFRCAADTAQ